MVKDGFKQTEIGTIPNDWTIKKINEITDATSGGTPSTFHSEYWNGKIRWMNSGEINLKKIYEVKGRITELGLKNSSTKLIPKNCVLIALAGQGKTRGTVAINYVELCINQSLGVILPNELFSPEYVYHNLDSRYVELRNLSSGGEGRGGLNLTLIKNIIIPFPPTIAEQNLIVKVLHDTDQIIGKFKNLIEKKKNIKQGVMQELLTGKRRLRGFHEEWGIRKLGKLSEMSSGGTPLTTVRSYYDGNIPWVVIADITSAGKYINNTEKNITEKGLQNSSAKKFAEGTLLFAMYASIGKCCIAKIDLSCNQAILGIETKKIDTEFLYQYMIFSQKKFSKIGQTGTQNNLNKEIVQNFDIPYPSIDEQIEISKILSDMDSEIKKLETKRDKYIKIKNGMMQKLLTGEIRLE